MTNLTKNTPKAIQIWPRLVLICFSFIFIQCATDKYIPSNESLLIKNKIEIVDPSNVDDKESLLYQLESFQKQKPNGNWLGLFPREGFYFRNSSPGDTSWWNRGIRKNIAELPTIYDSTETNRTTKDMELFLRNLKGYYKAKVKSEHHLNDKSSKVKYIVETGRRYTIDTISYIGFNNEILDHIENIKDESLLKHGDPIDVSLFEKEKSRISFYLQNEGYANFRSNRLKVYGDSSNLDFTVDVFLEVIPQSDSTSYQKYTIGDVNVYTDYFQDQDITKSDTVSIDNITYHRLSNSYVVKPSQLAKFISLKPGKAFNEKDRVKTFKKLNKLNVYRFSILKPEISANNDSILNFNIFLTPQSSKWITDFGLETFYSTISNGRQLIGASAFASLENRNLFGGGERNRLNLEAGGEIQFDLAGLATSTLRIQDNLEIPTFLDVFRTGRFMHRIGVMTDEEFNDFRRDATTNIDIGLSSLKINTLFDILSFNTSIGYSYLRNNRHQFSLSQLALNLNSYDLEQAFLDRIDGNELIEKSLEDNLLTGFLFRDFNYIYNSKKSIRGNSFRFIGNFEVSGWEIATINGLKNSLSSTNEYWKLFNTFEFSKYYRVELDSRYYKDLTTNTNFASRINIGLARPFYDSEQVPFIKQFYLGGPNSIRAWQIRELGPGSYEDPSTQAQQDSSLFFQQGDIKVQFSAEYRFDIISWIESALFIDGGNVWTLKEDVERAGSQLGPDFLNDIALGYGWGLRFDFDYFQIRFDFGYKLRSPYESARQTRWIPLRGQKIGTFNIGINYPY